MVIGLNVDAAVGLEEQHGRLRCFVSYGKVTGASSYVKARGRAKEAAPRTE
jgi:hypothetical protein